MSAPRTPQPATRRLRVYAFDPQASNEIETALINDATIVLPWETRWEDQLMPGPCNDYLEVVDFDPACDLFYAPVDLNDPLLLAQNGLPPSETRPQFHQQMVFAVAMKTIRLFERALGRPVLWTRELTPEERAKPPEEWPPYDLVKRLRVYPHALREPNAYYSPEKTALLFGYFRKGDGGLDEDQGWVFTCLSQDIIAHETTHAILHGMRRRSIEPTNPDSLAFHEAFADIVALFQHFTMTEVVAHQIAHSRGILRANTLLLSLATQFGDATGRNGPLRRALEMAEEEAARATRAQKETAEAGTTPSEPPSPTLATTTEPHDRGGFLVAAVFDAFVTIYERRTADLLRLVTGGSKPDGRELPRELVDRLAAEATKAADHVLRMCVRGLDYLPPSDARFGDYLRAVLTADADLVPDDPLRYRVALAESFRKRGIYVPNCLSMAPESLIWGAPDLGPGLGKREEERGLFADLLPRLNISSLFQNPAQKAPGGPFPNLRESSIRVIRHNQWAIWEWFNEPSAEDAEWEKLLGMQLCEDFSLKSIPTSRAQKKQNAGKLFPAVEVHSARIARRAGPNGEELHQLIIQMTQRRRAYRTPEEQAKADDGTLEQENPERWNEPDFWFRGGATLLVDMRDGRLRRVIGQRINDEDRLARQRTYREEAGFGFTQGTDTGLGREPFAFIHGG
jgi:hypothetical protein